MCSFDILIRRLFFLIILFPCTLHAFWPISWELDNEKRFFGPLVSYQTEKNTTHLTIRPFLFSYDSGDGGVYSYLYPLGKISNDRSYFVPIFLSKQLEEDKDTAFTLFFYGKSKRGNYFGLFPLYGKAYNRFGKDELGFFMWPLYSYSSAEGATKTNIIWPFFGYYSGKIEGFKAWPLYGIRKKKGVKTTSFFLWPFFIKEERDLDTDEPVDSFYAIPFYMKSTSKTKASYSVMWPIFSYARDDEKRKWDILWPIFSWKEGKQQEEEETKGYRFFPLFSYDKKGKDYTFNLLWPLYKESEWYVRDDRYFQRRILLINRYLEERNEVFFNIWPFFEYRRKHETSTFFFPSILPIRDAGFDDIVRPLFTLYEQRKKGDKNITNFLYGFYTKEGEDNNWKRRFAFLLELKKENGKFGFELLSGLFGIDSKGVKLFYIPFKNRTEE